MLCNLALVALSFGLVVGYEQIAGQPPLDGLVIFGDSLRYSKNFVYAHEFKLNQRSDTGNRLSLTDGISPSRFFYNGGRIQGPDGLIELQGRFTNGWVWHEYIPIRRVPVDRTLSNGSVQTIMVERRFNFAYGGARSCAAGGEMGFEILPILDSNKTLAEKIKALLAKGSFALRRKIIVVRLNVEDKCSPVNPGPDHSLP